MKRILLASTFIASAGLAHANSVDFSNIQAFWSSANPAANVTYFDNASSNPQAYWGGNNPSNQNPNGDSGYTFASPAVQPVTAIVPPSPSTPPFVLGQFQHINNPIPTGSSITGINLTITADVTINALFQGNEAFAFHFTHFETPNADDPCADGGANGVGVNSGGCADHVQVNALANTAFFDIGGDHYTINIIGFEQGGNTTTSFWTKEGVTNTANLIGDVELYSDVINPTGGVPEPSTWALALIGFGAVGVLALRRRAGMSAA